MSLYLPIDPNETLDFTQDWTTWLGEGSPTDSISSSSWLIEGGGSPLPSLSSSSNSTTVATIFVSGAEVGQVYRLTNKIVTAQGRTAERSFILLGAKR